MANVNKLLCQIESGDPSAADQLLLLVSEELRQIVAAPLPGDQHGQPFQHAALMHQAYLRLVTGALALRRRISSTKMHNGFRN